MALPFPSDYYRAVSTALPPSSSRPSTPATPTLVPPPSAPRPSDATPSMSSSAPARGITVDALAAAHKTRPIPAPIAHRPPTDDFNFAVPSLPPRLASFGRKISQMSSDFINELEGPSEGRNNTLGGSIPRPKSVASGPIDVPGMGDEPVMCPFCDKPLPPALFTAHAQQTHPTSGGGGTSKAVGLKRSHTTTATTSAVPRSGLGSGTNPTSPLARTQPALLDALPVESRAAGEKPDAADAAGPAQSVQTAGTVDSASLAGLVNQGEGASARAAQAAISEQDIKRWSELAGIPLPTPPPGETPAPTVSSEPVSASVPAGQTRNRPAQGTSRPEASRSSSTSSSRFGFFKRNQNQPKNTDDSDEDGEGGGGGYARLVGAGSDTEDEGDKEGGKDKDEVEVLHDEPKTMSTAEGSEVSEKAEEEGREEEKRDSGVEPNVSNEQLQSILREVLARVSEMSKSHTALVTSQSSLVTSLKIARSNLAMAEANTEMLEAQLKLQTSRAPPPGPASPSTPVSAARAVPGASGPSSRPASDERPRPSSLQIPVSSSVPEKSGWGFWSKDSKRKLPSGMTLPSPSQLVNALPSPNLEGAPYSAALPTAPTGFRAGDLSRSSGELQRSASYTHLPTSPPRGVGSPGASQAEIALLKRSLETAEGKIVKMNTDLEEMKKGKLEMEAELENLSQALFEEANKMVADERRKLAEVQEALKEVKEEREALRQTIKVLGGQSASGDGDEGSEGKSQGEAAEQVPLPEEFVPRDLDKHYEALRKSIHHVADGASPSPGMGGMGGMTAGSRLDQVHVPETVVEDKVLDTAMTATSTTPEQPIDPPADPNPWANPSPFSETAESATSALPGEEQLKGEKAGLEVDPTTKPSAEEDLERHMARLQEDMA